MTIHLYKGDLPAGLDLGRLVAMDTETLGLTLGRDRLCLVQLSSGDGHSHLVQIPKPGLDGVPPQAPNLVKQDADDPDTLWDAERFETTMAPFFAEYGELLFTPDARRHQWTQIRKTGDRQWEVTHTLLDPQGDNLWAIQGTIDLRNPDEAEGPIVRVGRIGA